jgi:hypothetical protein
MERDYLLVPAGTEQPDDISSNLDRAGKSSPGSHHPPRRVLTKDDPDIFSGTVEVDET